MPLLTCSRGAIVNILSLNAFAPLPAIPAYSISKAAAFNLTEPIGRATMLPTSVSGGLAALGPVAAPTKVGPAFYAFGLVLLPTLTFVELVTFQRATPGSEDYGYAARTARLRAYYFDNAPEVTPTFPAFRQTGDSPSKGYMAADGRPSKPSPGWSASTPPCSLDRRPALRSHLPRRHRL